MIFIIIIFKLDRLNHKQIRAFVIFADVPKEILTKKQRTTVGGDSESTDHKAYKFEITNRIQQSKRKYSSRSHIATNQKRKLRKIIMEKLCRVTS